MHRLKFLLPAAICFLCFADAPPAPKVENIPAQNFMGVTFHATPHRVYEKTMAALAKTEAYLATIGQKQAGPGYLCQVSVEDSPQFFAGYPVEHVSADSKSVFANKMEAYKAVTFVVHGGSKVAGQIEAGEAWTKSHKLTIRTNLPYCRVFLKDAGKLSEDGFDMQFRIPVK